MALYCFPRQKLNLCPASNAKPIVLILCGSFSPISLMHLRMMEMAKDWIEQQFTSKQVIGGYISPVSNFYQKEGLIPAEHRIEMCRLAVKDSPWLMVDDWECTQSSSWSKTCQVLEHFQQELCGIFEAIEIAFVMGSDLFKSITEPKLWSPLDVKQLLDNAFFLVIERECDLVELRMLIFSNDMLNASQEKICIVHQVIPTSMSSSLIRLLCKRRLSIRYLVHDAVFEYIEKHKLYL
jgi:nicotinamide mononucleotide adenylyltransferase